MMQARQFLQHRVTLLPSLRRFSTINLSSIKRDEVVSASDSKWMGSYIQAVVKANDEAGAGAADEYFRKNFRKLSSAQALDIVNALATTDVNGPALCLDSRFWVWESLEQALHPEVDEMHEEDYMNTLSVFASNYKGGQDFLDDLEARMYREGDQFGDQ